MKNIEKRYDWDIADIPKNTPNKIRDNGLLLENAGIPSIVATIKMVRRMQYRIKNLMKLAKNSIIGEIPLTLRSSK